MTTAMEALVQSVVALALLLMLSCLVAPLAQRFRLPHSVLLAAIGLGIGLAGIGSGLLPQPLAGEFGGNLQAFGLSAQGFLVLFLPPLLFAAGLQVDVRLLMDEMWAVLLLAVVAVLVTTAVVGATLAEAAGIQWTAALLLGAIIATTDPAAVVAVFRDLGATKRLRVIVEGESLLNDACAIALFGALTSLALPGGEDTAKSVALSALPSFVIGAAVGIAAGQMTFLIFNILGRSTVVQAALSLVVPYLTYVAADHGLGVSGVVAVAFAGLAVAQGAPSRLPPDNWLALQRLWTWIEFVAVSIVFLVASMLAAQLMLGLSLATWLLCFLVFAAAFAARAMVLYGLLPLLTLTGLAQKVDQRFKAIILWGGLRGAITLILALAVMENESLPRDVRHMIATVAVGYVWLTLFISAPMLRPLLRFLGLDRLSVVEETMRERVLAVSVVRRKQQLQAAALQLGLTGEDLEATREQLDDDGHTAPALPAAQRQDIALVTLAAHERSLYLRHFSEQLVSLRVIARLVTSADRLRDAASANGREGYERVANRALATTARLHIALWLYRWLRIARPLERALEDRYEFLLVRRRVLRELQVFVQATIARFFGNDVGEESVRILKERETLVNDALHAMTLRFGDYAEALARHHLTRTALRLEQAEYEERLADSLITQEIFEAHQRRLTRKAQHSEERPSLELNRQMAAMIRGVPMFQNLKEEEIRWIAGRLEPRLATPGERIIRAGEAGDSVYFIAAGSVDVVLPNRSIRLEAGNFVGEMALLQDQPRTADVVSVGYTQLLVLRVRTFRAMLRRHKGMRAAMEATAKARQAENLAHH
jgi:monovalent cation:H+ antiporter, CPA1 family